MNFSPFTNKSSRPEIQTRNSNLSIVEIEWSRASAVGLSFVYNENREVKLAIFVFT